MKSERKEALAILSSPHFFQQLREVIRDAGLPGEEELGIGVFFVAASRFQAYPLNLRIDEKTEGTANYLVKKVGKLLPEGSVVTVDILKKKEWQQLQQSHEHKVVYFPQLEIELTGDKYRRLEARQNQFIRVKGVKEEGRFVEEKIEDSDVVEGRFACITSEYFPEYRTRPRWLTMKQPDQRSAVSGNKRAIKQKTIAVWQEIQECLKERAGLPIAFPEWQQLAVDMMVERKDSAALNVPTFLQSWRTMCLLRSFTFGKTEVSQTATFKDFAAAVLLTKALFKEAQHFPSPKKIFDNITSPGTRDDLFHPITGKLMFFHHKTRPFRNLLGF